MINTMRRVILILGDSNTGKTESLRSLLADDISSLNIINSQISLYHMTVPVVDVEQSAASLNVTIWDCSGKLIDLNGFILLNQLSTCILFCNLTNSPSCDRLHFWKQLFDKQSKTAQIIVVGTYINKTPDIDKSAKVRDRNKIKVLEWCVSNGDIPFFEINLSDETQVHDMYNSILQ